MDIVYHSQKLVNSPSGSFIEQDSQGGAIPGVAEKKIAEHMSNHQKIDLAFCLAFLDYRAAFRRCSDGKVRLIACVTEWDKDVRTAPIDPNCHLLKHGAFQGNSLDATEVGKWIAKTFSDPCVKLGIISGPRRQVVIALMRNGDELITIANGG